MYSYEQENSNILIRKEASICCVSLISKTPEISLKMNGVVVNDVIEKLLSVGISDEDSSIRSTILSALDNRFDKHLAQSFNLQKLFIGLMDEMFENRELSVRYFFD